MTFSLPERQVHQNASKHSHVCYTSANYLDSRLQTEGPATTLAVVLLDMVKLKMLLPGEKLATLKAIPQHNGGKTPGRPRRENFSHSLYPSQSHPSREDFSLTLTGFSRSATKLHHRIKLNSGARTDFKWRLDFLPSWNGILRRCSRPQPLHRCCKNLRFRSILHGTCIMVTWSPNQL